MAKTARNRRAVKAFSCDPKHSSVDLHSFTKTLVAGLVELNVTAVHPHSVVDRRAFHEVVRLLDRRVKTLIKDRNPRQMVLSVAKIANELRPSNTGSFEGFEAALRSLQLTFTASPNPFYDDITFPVSKTQAQSFLANSNPVQRQLALDAAKVFAAARRSQSSS